ncbi:Polar tube protein 3, partial [Dictyocoela roeselum]
TPEDLASVSADEEEGIIQKGYVPAEIVQNLENQSKEIIGKDEEIIRDLAQENAQNLAEKEKLKEQVDSAPKNWAEDVARRLEREQTIPVSATDSILKTSAETRGDQLGVIATIPDNADSVDLHESRISLPLKTFSDVEAENPLEAEAQKAQNSLRDDLRNKVTEKKFDSPLNVIKGVDGYLNVPESAKEIEIADGKVFFPEGIKEMMEKNGQDTSMLRHKINVGENKNIAEGLGYYEADVSGMKMRMPSPLTPNAGSVLTGKNGNLDISRASEMLINDGKLKLEPWDKYSHKVRPKINQPVRVTPEKSVEERNLYTQAQKAARLLDNTETQIYANPGGNEFVEVKPPFGVTQHIPMEDVIESLSGTMPSGQGAESQLESVTGSNYKLPSGSKGKPRSLNMLDNENKPTKPIDLLDEEGVEEMVADEEIKAMIPPKNAFNGEISEEQAEMFGDEEGEPEEGLTEEQYTELLKELPKDRVEIIDNIYKELKTNPEKNAESMNITTEEYITFINGIPPSTISEFYEYSLHPFNTEQRERHEYNLESLKNLAPIDITRIQNFLFRIIRRVTGSPNPMKIKPAPPKRLQTIVYDKPKGKNRKVKKLIYTDDVTKKLGKGPNAKRVRMKKRGKKPQDKGMISVTVG